MIKQSVRFDALPESLQAKLRNPRAAHRKRLSKYRDDDPAVGGCHERFQSHRGGLANSYRRCVPVRC
jgi:hypothetical protein